MLNRKLAGLLALIVLFTAVFISPAPTASAQGFYMACDNTTSPYYQTAAFLRYSPNSQRVTLVNYNTGQELREMAFNEAAGVTFRQWNWSPDCRYVTASWSPTIYMRPATLLIWDALTGEQVNTLEQVVAQGNYIEQQASGVIWSADSTHALIRTRTGTFIWDVAAGTNTLLAHTADIIPDYEDIAWDYARNRVLISGYPVVSAYDLTTGTQQAVYPAAEGVASHCHFQITPDMRTLVVYTEHAYTGEAVGYATAWDLTTDTGRELDTDGFAANFVSQTALSPDGRYFVIGMEFLRVWDLTSDEPAPIARYPLNHDINVRMMHFIDETTLVVPYYGVQLYMDVTTGGRVRVPYSANLPR